MIKIADNTVEELLRHLPVLLGMLPKIPNTQLRKLNALRMTKMNIEKLKKSYDEQRGNQQRNQRRGRD